MKIFNNDKIWLLALMLVSIVSCRSKADEKAVEAFFNQQLITWNKNLTSVIISDVLTPPVCSRAYAYSNIAAYEALRAAHPGHFSYDGKLNGLKNIPQPAGDKKSYLFS